MREHLAAARGDAQARLRLAEAYRWMRLYPQSRREYEGAALDDPALREQMAPLLAEMAEYQAVLDLGIDASAPERVSPWLLDALVTSYWHAGRREEAETLAARIGQARFATPEDRDRIAYVQAYWALWHDRPDDCLRLLRSIRSDARLLRLAARDPRFEPLFMDIDFRRVTGRRD